MKSKTAKKTVKQKRVAAGVAAAVLAASVGVNRSFEPEELIHTQDHIPAHTQHAQIHMAGETGLATYADEERITLGNAIRAWFIKLPLAVKGLFLMPLWVLGSLPSALFASLGPVWGAVLGFFFQIAVLVGLFCLVYKLLFPDKKVRDLFKKKNLKWLLVGAVTVTAANVVLTSLWTGWPIVRSLALSGVGMGVLCLLYKRLCGKFKAPEPVGVTTRLVLEY